jgi:hypothetical protein
LKEIREKFDLEKGLWIKPSSLTEKKNGNTYLFRVRLLKFCKNLRIWIKKALMCFLVVKKFTQWMFKLFRVFWFKKCLIWFRVDCA